MDQAAADRARASINRVGQFVTFKRGNVTATVKAAVEGYKPDELVNGITQGSRRVIVSKLDLVVAAYPVPPKKGDRVDLAGDRPTTIQTVDPDHREYQGCYELLVAGA